VFISFRWRPLRPRSRSESSKKRRSRNDRYLSCGGRGHRCCCNGSSHPADSMRTDKADCGISPTASQIENRGLAWLLGAFVICPCHLPLTLGLATTMLAGTALGALVSGHLYVAGAVITSAWLAATWRGIRHLQLARQRSGPGRLRSAECWSELRCARIWTFAGAGEPKLTAPFASVNEDSRPAGLGTAGGERRESPRFPSNLRPPA
jgi:hypothetical protein